MSDGNTDAAANEVEDAQWNVVHILGGECCVACWFQQDELQRFQRITLDDETTVTACPSCSRGRVLEENDPFLAQRRRWIAEGQSA